MVREYSADGARPQESDDSAAQPLDLRGGAVNLTQELAQLLAASIAQNQPGKRSPGGTPTGSELASLAALVSSQRPAAPSFKDGLSSLSYTPAPANSSPGTGLLVNDHHDDEPMPIPSTWRQPVGSDDERWYRQQLGAAALGLTAGLIVVIPSVLWLSGYMGGSQARPRHAGADMAPVTVADAKPAVVKATADIVPIKVQTVPIEKVEKTESVGQFVAASIDPRALAAPPPVVEETSPPIPVPVPRVVEPPRPKAEDLLLQAERRISSGDVLGARDFLVANETIAPGPMTFALAETYDPLMLAAWGVRGGIADVLKARSLYSRARDLGEVRAQARLELLK